MFRVVSSIFFAVMFAMPAFANSSEIPASGEIWLHSNEVMQHARSFSYTGSVKANLLFSGLGASPQRLPFLISGSFSGRMVKPEARIVPNVAFDASVTVTSPLLGPNPMSVDLHYRVIDGTCYTQMGPTGMPTEWKTGDCAELNMPSEIEMARIKERNECGIQTADFFALDPAVIETAEGIERYSLAYRLDKTKAASFIAAVACLTAQDSTQTPEARQALARIFSEFFSAVEWSGNLRAGVADFSPQRVSANIRIHDFRPAVSSDDTNAVVVNGTVVVDVAFRDYGTAPEIAPPETEPSLDDVLKELCSQIPAGDERPEECSKVR